MKEQLSDKGIKRLLLAAKQEPILIWDDADHLRYKNYIAQVTQLQDGIYYGKIIEPANICCIFEGNSIHELEQDFMEMIKLKE